MSHPKKGFTLVELLIALVLFLIIGSGVFWVVVKVLQSIASTAGEAKQTTSIELNTDWLIFDLKHVGYGIAVTEPSLVLSFCNGSGSSTNDACRVANDIGAEGGKALLLKETTNIADTGCSSYDPDFGFGFVLWNGTSVVYQETPCDVCGIYRNSIKCVWLTTKRLYNGTDICCNGTASAPLVGYPIDTDSACDDYSSNPACCSDQNCTGIVWYLKTTSTYTPITHCLNETYVLYRKTTSSDGGFEYAKPVADCIADWTIWFGLDTDGDGKVDTWVNEIPNSYITANQDLRQQLKIAKIYFLIQASYTPQADYDFCKISANDCDNKCGNGYILADQLVDADGTTHYVCLKHPSSSEWVHYKWRIVTIPVSGFFDIP